MSKMVFMLPPFISLQYYTFLHYDPTDTDYPEVTKQTVVIN